MFTNFKTYISDLFGAIVEAVQKKTVDTMFSAFWIGNYYMAVVERFFDRKSSHWIIKKLFWRNPVLNEPQLATWYLCSTLTKNGDQYGFNEKYVYSTEEIQEFSAGEVEKLYICKKDGFRISRWSTPKIKHYPVDYVPEKSKVKFISILYSHPKMNNMLTLKLDLEYLREGNNLFNKSFVLRMLKYSYPADQYVFDENYELKVMDDKIHTSVIGYNKYMVVNSASKTGYTVVTVSD